MDFRDNRTVRVISSIVLTFFLWTFGGVFEIAYAISNSSEAQKSLSSETKNKEKKLEDKFQDALEKIRNAEEKIDGKIGRAEAIEDEETEIKNQKTEIEKLDVEIRKQFSETEDRIKNLPEVIKQRHRDFVKKYEENLNTLNANLDDIEKAKTKQEKTLAHKKAREFLEKVKPPSRHVPLDPNKLPHRTAEPIKKKPRTKPEEFKEIQDAGYKIQDKKFADEFPTLEKGGKGGFDKPILVASNGPLKWILNSSPVADSTLYAAVTTQAINPPTAADLSQTIEVQFTPEIKAKAEELGNNPVKIYNWVRNNIEYVPTYGSIQGANYCLQTKQCNDFDTASLLIALLRASGIHAKYVYGTIELPIEKVKNWVGGFTDTNSALTLIASGGIPVIGLTEGGQIKYVQMEHVWVEAWIDYVPSRGARHKTGQGDTWIPLDASFKQYNYTQGIDIKTAVPFDAQSFVNQIKNTATINETEGYVTSVSSSLIQQTMTDYQTRVQNYITQNYPNATVGDVLGKKEVIKQEFPYMLGTLPYRMIVKGAKYSSIPDSLRHKLTFNVTKDIYDELFGAPINITKSLPELAGKKITLSYSPATSSDEAVINSYLPQPHPDGTPIQPSELPSSLPAYLINLKPELRIDGQVVATGSAVGMGNAETFTMTFSSPQQNANDVISNQIEAGEYLGIALNLVRISQEQMTALKTKLEATKAKLQSQNLTGLTKDDILGDLLYTTALSYYAELDAINSVVAKSMDVIELRFPSEAMFSLALSVRYFYGIPVSVSAGGLAMDVDRDMVAVKSKNGDVETTKQYMLISGSNGSALEHSVPEQLFSTPENPAQGISAVKALQIANNQGIPIYTINQSNINTVIPQLQLDSGTKTDIQNAVNAGKIVTVSKTEINFNGWTGVGYIIIDPNTGSGAYMISGGVSGGWITGILWMLISLLLLALLIVAALISPIALLIVALLIPAYIVFLGWLSSQASEGVRNCIQAIIISLVSLWAFIRLLPSSGIVSYVVLRIVINTSVNRIGRECFGIGIAY